MARGAVAAERVAGDDVGARAARGIAELARGAVDAFARDGQAAREARAADAGLVCRAAHAVARILERHAHAAASLAVRARVVRRARIFLAEAAETEQARGALEIVGARARASIVRRVRARVAGAPVHAAVDGGGGRVGPRVGGELACTVAAREGHARERASKQHRPSHRTHRRLTARHPSMLDSSHEARPRRSVRGTRSSRGEPPSRLREREWAPVLTRTVLEARHAALHGTDELRRVTA